MDRGTTVLENGVPVFQNQGGEEARLLADDNLDHWRASASVDYLSSFLFRQAWSETYSQAIDAEVRSVAYLSHNLNGFSLNASADRYQDFYQNPLTDTFSNQIKISHLPTAEANALERPLLGSPLFWAVDASAGGLQSQRAGRHAGPSRFFHRQSGRPSRYPSAGGAAAAMERLGSASRDCGGRHALYPATHTVIVSSLPVNPVGTAGGN